MSIILTIKPEHFKRIVSGEKMYEFRKRKIKKAQNTKIYFCVSGSRGKILGICEFIAEFHFDTTIPFVPKDVGIKLSDGEKSFVDCCEKYYGYQISNFEQCNLHIGDFGLKRVPQSFQYVEHPVDRMLKKLREDIRSED